tara:strand:- start:71 stop:295 length:225 start_codon:yes stop_codon:yes gene_type:complete
MPQRQIVNCETGEVTFEDLTAEEIQNGLDQIAAQEQADAAQEAAATQAAIDKDSANQKLKALGLTDAEIAALVT